LAAGLVSHVFPASELTDRAVDLAKSFCIWSPATTRYAKLALNAAADLPLADALAYAHECQRAVRDGQAGSYSERFRTKED
jgi:enoyl-CoA hydratase/carnithine racemase